MALKGIPGIVIAAAMSLSVSRRAKNGRNGKEQNAKVVGIGT
jgi:hypothetical protein